MNKAFLSLTLLSLLSLGACQRELDTPQTPQAPQPEQLAAPSGSAATSGLPTAGAEPGKLYIRVRQGAQRLFRDFAFQQSAASSARALQALPEQMARSLRSISTETLQPVFPIDPRFEKRMRRAGLDRWYVVHFDQKQELRSAMRTLSAVPEIEYTEPVYPMTRPAGKAIPTDLPVARRASSEAMPYNDPLLSDQWHYHNVGKYHGSIASADIDLFKAWKIETGKPKVIVSIVDGGIDLTHPDLVDNLYVNEEEKNGTPGVDDDQNGYIDDIHGYNFIKDDATIYPDKESHGTHVAGTVAARTGNGIGVSGIAGGNGTPGSGVRIMSCQIFGAEKENGDSPAAIVYGANNGAVISQNSWGYPYKAQITAIPKVIQDAVDYFIKYAGCDDDGNQLPESPMKGGVVIFAAGNDGMDYYSYPAAYDAIIAVSSMAPNWTAAYYSNRGDWVDIMAPGGDLNFPNGQVLSTLSKQITGKEYGYMQGTSMACPHVSGIAALIVSHFGGPGFTAEQCKERLLGSLKFKNIDAANPKYAGRLGRGYIDASAVFATNQHKAPQRVSAIQAEHISFSTADLSWEAVRDEDDRVASYYKVYFADQQLTAANVTSHLVSEINAAGIEAGSKVFYPVAGLKEDTEYHVAVEAIDRWGQSSGLSFARFKTKKNTPPSIKFAPERPLRVSALEKRTFHVQVTDPDHQKVSIQLSGEQRGVSYQQEGDLVTFTLRAIAPVGKHELLLTAVDELGAKSELRIPFEVYEYQPPTFSASLGSQIVGLGKDRSLDVTTALSYDKESPLSFKAHSADGKIASASISAEGRLTIHGKQKGVTSIILEVSDGISQPITTTLPLRVVNDTQAIVYSVYPLPATTELNIALDPTIDQAQVELRSLMGVQVLEKTFQTKGSGAIRILTSRLTPGSYTLHVRTAKGKYTQAFVKN